MRLPPRRQRRSGLGARAFALASLLAVSGASGVGAADEIAPDHLLLAQAADDPTAEREDAPVTPGESTEAAPAESGTTDSSAGIDVINVRTRAAGALETDVPSSITQFDASTIEALGAQDISDLSRVTPNVNIVQPGATQATFFVRGVGLSDFSSNAAGAVTIFQDDVALNAPAIQTGQLFDVEGIDVVRGPQGTGPFRNASAGAIRVRSRRPTGNYGASLRTSFGRYDTHSERKGAKKALIQDYEGALEMPILASALSSRFAFRLREAEPYRTNGCGYANPFARPDGVSQCGEQVTFGVLDADGNPKIPFGLPKHINDEHNWAARGTLRFHPDDTDYDFFVNAHGSRLDQDSTLGQAIGTNFAQGRDVSQPIFGGSDVGGYIDPDVQREFLRLCGDSPAAGINCANFSAQAFATSRLAKRLAGDRPLDENPYRGDYNRVGETTRDAWGLFASGEAPVFAETKLFGLVSYDQYERFQDQDTDFTPNRLFEVEQGDEAWQTYSELRLEGELEAEPVTWEVGGYYLKEKLDVDNTVFIGTNPFLPLNTSRIYTQKIDSSALWGEFGWEFADDFTLEGGVRWNWERKRFDLRKIGGRLTTSDVSDDDEEIWSTPTGQIILTYHLDADKSAYARYTRGFKAGHYNSLASEISQTEFRVDPADEEYNDAWETGLRGSWFGRRLSLAGSFFYYRYENYQVFLFTDSAEASEPPTLEIVNAKQAENYGIEIEGGLQPLEGWAPRVVSGLRLSANFSWLHGEYLNFTTFRKFLFAGFPTATNVAADYSGQPLQNSPEYKVSGTLEWTLDLGRFGYVIPRYDINWSDDVFFDPNEGHGSIDPIGRPQLVDYGVGQKAYFLHNVRLGYRTPSGNVEVAGWIRNVEDQTYKNYAFDASRFSGLVINFPGEPRTMGVDVVFTF